MFCMSPRSKKQAVLEEKGRKWLLTLLAAAGPNGWPIVTSTGGIQIIKGLNIYLYYWGGGFLVIFVCTVGPKTLF